MSDADARLRALEDRAALQDLVALYASLIGRGRGPELAALFTDEGVVAGGGRELGGAALSDFYNRMDQPGVTIPMVTNCVFEITGDTATGYASLLGYDGPPEPRIFCGYYADRFVRRDGRWLFARRDFTHFFGPPQAQPAVSSEAN